MTPSSGLLRVLATDEDARVARAAARADFERRFLDAMGYPLPRADAERWWPNAE